MLAPDILDDPRGPLVDTARHLRVQRLTMESVAQYGLRIGVFLRVSVSRFRFGAHTLILASRHVSSIAAATPTSFNLKHHNIQQPPREGPFKTKGPKKYAILYSTA